MMAICPRTEAVRVGLVDQGWCEALTRHYAPHALSTRTTRIVGARLVRGSDLHVRTRSHPLAPVVAFQRVPRGVPLIRDPWCEVRCECEEKTETTK